MIEDEEYAQMYHRGFLAIDRVDNPPIDQLANEMYSNYLSGTHILFQRRLSPNRYEYYIKRL